MSAERDQARHQHHHRQEIRTAEVLAAGSQQNSGPLIGSKERPSAFDIKPHCSLKTKQLFNEPHLGSLVSLIRPSIFNLTMWYRIVFDDRRRQRSQRKHSLWKIGTQPPRQHANSHSRRGTRQNRPFRFAPYFVGVAYRVNWQAACIIFRCRIQNKVRLPRLLRFAESP